MGHVAFPFFSIVSRTVCSLKMDSDVGMFSFKKLNVFVMTSLVTA
ncbi:hypothetical protein N9O24_00545 [bacterium]|nr:hypothetical protein [bacterium]